MKKTFPVFILVSVLCLLSACGSSASPSQTSQPEPTLAPTEAVTPADSSEIQDDVQETVIAPAETSGSHILVAYFSRIGNTVFEPDVDAVTSASINVQNGEFFGNAQLLAQMAQEATGGDLFLIETVETYPSAYRDTTDLASVEQAQSARPALASHVENMDDYDTIILIYPNWWGTLPMPLYTFLEEYDFSGKTILPLCTHEGSRMGSSESAIASLCPDATLLGGLAVRGGSAASAQADVESWINNSGILG